MSVIPLAQALKAGSACGRSTRGRSGRVPIPFPATLDCLIELAPQISRVSVCGRSRPRGTLHRTRMIEARLGAAYRSGWLCGRQGTSPCFSPGKSSPSTDGVYEIHESSFYSTYAYTRRSIAICCAALVQSETELRTSCRCVRHPSYRKGDLFGIGPYIAQSRTADGSEKFLEALFYIERNAFPCKDYATYVK